MDDVLEPAEGLPAVEKPAPVSRDAVARALQRI